MAVDKVAYAAATCGLVAPVVVASASSTASQYDIAVLCQRPIT